MIFANGNLPLYSLFAIVGFYRRTFSPPTSRRLPPSRYACHLPPGGRLLQRMSSRLCSYIFALLARSRTLCLLLRSLSVLPHTSRRLPPSRYACHLPPGGRLLWEEKQRIICFSRGVVQRNKAHVMRLVSVLCHAVFGLGGGYTMRLSIKKRMRVLHGKIRCKNGRM